MMLQSEIGGRKVEEITKRKRIAVRNEAAVKVVQLWWG
jgi:hypothetical protein